MLAVVYVGIFLAVLCMLMTSCCCRPQLLAFSMLDICYKFGVENDIIFNQKKICLYQDRTSLEQTYNYLQWF